MDFFTGEVLTVVGLVRYHVLFVIDIGSQIVEVEGLARDPGGDWMKPMARNLSDAQDGKQPLRPRPGTRRMKEWTMVGQCLAVVCMVVLCSAADARSGNVVCGDSRVRIIGSPEARWVDPIFRACATLSLMGDRDESAQVRLFVDGPDVLVQVSLEDGRSASRVVHSPEDLEVTLEALLSVPPVLRGVSRRAAPATKTPADDPELPVYDEPTAQPGAWDDALGLEAGATIGPRLAGPGPQIAASVSGFAQLRLRSWLFGMGMRGDIVEARRGESPPAFEMDTIAIALTMAQRVRLSSSYVDLGVSPRFILDTQSAEIGKGAETSDSKTDVRLALFARLGWGSSKLRLLLEGDVEVSPGHLRRDTRIDPMFPLLPTWTAGVGIGASWSQP
ncbi:MAG: hypothetical protein ABJA82_01450 [Myxococcales bacterium]